MTDEEFQTGLEMLLAQFEDVLSYTWDDDQGVVLARAANGAWIEAKVVEDNDQNYVCWTTSWGDQYCDQFTFTPDAVLIDVDIEWFQQAGGRDDGWRVLTEYW